MAKKKSPFLNPGGPINIEYIPKVLSKPIHTSKPKKKDGVLDDISGGAKSLWKNLILKPSAGLRAAHLQQIKNIDDATAKIRADATAKEYLKNPRSGVVPISKGGPLPSKLDKKVSETLKNQSILTPVKIASKSFVNPANLTAFKEGYSGKQKVTGEEIAQEYLKGVGGAGKHPTASKVIGFSTEVLDDPFTLIPIMGAEKTVGKGLAKVGLKFAPKIFSTPLGQIALKGVGTGIGYGTMEGVGEGKSAKDTALNAVKQGLVFGGLGVGGYGTSKALNKLKPVLRATAEVSEKPAANLAETKKVLTKKVIESPEYKITPKLKIPFNLELFGEYKGAMPDTLKQIASKTEKPPINFKGMSNEAYIKTIDDLYPLRKVDKITENVLGRPLKASESVYKLGQNTRNANVISNQIATNQFVGSNLEGVGEGFNSITKQIPKGAEKEFEDYLINKHAPSWTTLDRKVFPEKMGVTNKISRVKVSEYEAKHPEFKKIAQQLYDFRDKMAQEYLVKPGIISKEAYKAMKEKYPYYVPLRRQIDEMAQPLFKGPKKGFANQTSPVKKAEGSERPIISPIESTIEDIDKYVNVAKRNEVMQTLIKNVQNDPGAFSGLIEIYKEPKENLITDINETLQNEGIDGVVDKFNRQFDEVFSKRKTGGNNIITGMVNGNKVHVKIKDPQLLEALTNLTPEAQGVLVNSIGKVTGVMKALTTGINPVFSLARNIFRDIPTAYMNSPSTSNPIKFGVDLLHSFGSTLADTLPKSAKEKVGWINSLSKLHQEYKAAGGGHSSALSADRNLLTESKAKALPGYYDIKNPIRSTKRVAKQGVNIIGQLNDAVESAPRMGEFKRIAKNGDYASKVEGIYQANDVTVNFNKKGKWGKEADAVVPYLNAGLQGIDKIGRQFIQDPVKTSAKAFLSVTVPTILLYGINHNNPNYQKLNDYTKDNYFLIPKANGTFFKIPKPREVGVLFGSFVERALRQWNDNDPNGFENFIETVKANFTPPTRTIIAPFNDLRANKDFVDRPIVPADLQKLSPKNQYDEKTSEVSKTIGRLLNVSPKQLDYLSKSYLGVLAQLGIPATTKGSSVGETLKRQITVDPLYSNDILNRFYERKNQLDTEYNDIIHTKDFDGRTKGQVMMDMQLRRIYSQVSSLLSKYRKEINRVESSNIPGKQKERKIRQLQSEMQKYAEQANKY